MVNSAHCLLSIGNKNPNQIPSKVVEYLATGKPIIHFTEIDNDPVIKLSDEFDNLITINKSVEEENLSLLIKKCLIKLKNLIKINLLITIRLSQLLIIRCYLILFSSSLNNLMYQFFQYLKTSIFKFFKASSGSLILYRKTLSGLKY